MKNLVLFLTIFITNPAFAEYYIFAGAHAGNTYYDKISDSTTTYDLDESHFGNKGLDVLASWGTKDYGIGLTYTRSQHLAKTDITGVRMHQQLSGPGVIFTNIYKNPQKAKTMTFIGVESLTLNNKNTSCTGNETLCQKLEKDLDGTTAQSLVLGIIDTSSSGLAIGIVGRAYKSDAIERGYDLNLLIGVAF